ncbi:MAG: aminopeptidase [Pseudomonadales bacterium]|nr:aminopeptidase [Pseudomonadales bacterium]
MKRFRNIFFAILLGAVLLACESVRYYGQAAKGQLTQIFAARPIAVLIEDPEQPPRLRDRLSLILDIRQFVEDEMLLPAGKSYLRYVDLQREYVVWNVFAAPELSLQALRWCYPIAGCVSYRGYFSEQGAQRKALQLEEQGYDVYVGGVDAYSTLGWFSDPVNNAFIRRSEAQLVNLIAHELAHKRFYVAGDTQFNESYASFVGQEALRRWVGQKNEMTNETELLDIFRRDLLLQEEFVALIMHYRERLSTLYDSTLDEAAMRAEKRSLQAQLRQDYQSKRLQWGDGRYDRWFAGPLNNAQLSTVADYNALVPAFSVLLQNCQQDMDCFYQQVETVASMDAEQRQQHLSALLPAALPATGQASPPVR